MRNKGQIVQVVNVAAMAIALFVVIIVIAQLANLNTGLSGASQAAFGNVSSYTWIAVGLLAIGILVYAGMSIMGFFGVGGRRR